MIINRSSIRIAVFFFWKNQKALILGDIHLGKDQHFRKAGIPIPPHATSGSLEKLKKLIRKTLTQPIIK